MDGVTIPFLPTAVWLFAAALAIILVLFSFAHYLYYQRRMKALIEDGATAANLAAKKENLEADVEALRNWIDKQRDELNRVKAEREEQERLRADLDHIAQQAAIQDQKNETLRREVGELENQRYMVTQTLDKLNQEIGNLESQRSEANYLREDLRQLKKKVDDTRQSMENLAKIEAKLVVFKTEQVAIEQQVVESRSSAELATKEAEVKRQEANDASRNAEIATNKLRAISQEKAELESSLFVLVNRQESLMKNIERIEIAIAKRGEAERETQEVLEELRIAKNERRREQEMVEELSARRALLESRIMELSGQIDGKDNVGYDPYAAYSDLLLVPSQCLKKTHFKAGINELTDEWVVLQNLRKQLRIDDIKFPNRIIDAFHTSLKCHDINPLTVLAGVSGTGKTLLPTYYSGIMGMHSLVMAVQPRWDSPQDMFGFYNYIEKQYKATELSRALVLMDPFYNERESFKNIDGRWTQDRMLLVLLDEMNLARTEYYFSEFLSKLELRRLVKNTNSSDDRNRAEIELDVGPIKELLFRFWVGSNVLFVGTMNEDETTQSLSDKVLDRANVLRFGKPDGTIKPSHAGGSNTKWSEKYLSFKTWNSWLRKYNENEPWFDDVVKWSIALNDSLNRVGRPFGHRVQQAIATYVANYPLVEQDERHALAFSDQVEQKIIPKLRGVEIGEPNSNECLNELNDVISKLGDKELEAAFQQARAESEHIGLFQWRGVTRPVEDLQ